MFSLDKIKRGFFFTIDIVSACNMAKFNKRLFIHSSFLEQIWQIDNCQQADMATFTLNHCVRCQFIGYRNKGDL